MPQEEASSPTIALESLMATLLIDAHEERDVATFNIPEAYLHAKLLEDKFVLLKIEGPFVDIMCEVNPDTKKMSRLKVPKRYCTCKSYRHSTE